MTLESLDYYFPFIVLIYGIMIGLVTHLPALLQLAEEKMPPRFVEQLKAHRVLAVICLFVGSLWSLQNLMI